MVRSQAGLGCCVALAPSAAILIPSQPPQGRRQAASSQGQEKSSPVSQKIWRKHGVWLRRKTRGHCVERWLKNRANSGCLYCQPQTKAQGLSLTSFAVDEMPRCLWKDVCLPTCLQGAGGLCLDSSKLHQCISPRPCSSCFVASCSKITW